MPPVQPPRPGLEQLAEEGEEWQYQKYADLHETFGEGALIVNGTLDVVRHRLKATSIELWGYLPRATAGSFLIECKFEVGSSFENALNITNLRSDYNLQYSGLIPDIIEILPPRSFTTYIDPDGKRHNVDDDARLQLRVIDIKLTSEPSPAYLTEITYYSMALSGWLKDQGLDSSYIVVPDAAIWPGSHEASNLVVYCRECAQRRYNPTYQDLLREFHKDLEVVPFEVFSGRLKDIFQKDVPYVLARPWDELPYHVDNRCKSCDYTGQPWVDRNKNRTWHDLHCIPTAIRENHLSRVAFISRGASIALTEGGVTDVSALAALSPISEAFESHFALRAGRNVISGRAASLQNNSATIPQQTGTSAVMPRWADLHIYLRADFDIGSAITFDLGIEAYWIEPLPYGVQGPKRQQRWGPFTFIIDRRDPAVEQRELISLLDKINTILTQARTLKAQTTVQFYIWDNIQYKHFTRIVGRHLPNILANDQLRRLAWLFPPEQILPNSDLESRMSPITIVKDVVKAVLAAPVPHYYTSLQIARAYHHDSLPQRYEDFRVHPIFEDLLSDQIPSERAHDIWARTANWNETDGILRETVKTKLRALGSVTRRLESDLSTTLQQTAPRIRIDPPDRVPGVSFDGQLWYGFSQLNLALEELEIYRIRAMPPDERAARFKSARLSRRLHGQEETDALACLGINPRPRRRIYKLGRDSKEVKLRAGDFTYAISPEDDPGFLDRNYRWLTRDTPLAPQGDAHWQTRMEDVCSVTIVAIDRERGLIAIDPNNRNQDINGNQGILDDLELNNLVDFSADVILDPIHIDTFTRKLYDTLRAIGNPENAQDTQVVRQAVGLTNARRAPIRPNHPAGDILWDAERLAITPNNRNLAGTRDYLITNGISLNDSQWNAWESSLSRQLQLIWGPPGTGKTRTLQAIVIGAVVDAIESRTPQRILVTAPTYHALDNVLLEVNRKISQIVDDSSIELLRLRSLYRQLEPDVPTEIDVELDRWNPSSRINSLKRRLKTRQGCTIVGATPEQVHNLLISGNDSAMQEVFDLTVIDEASQVDVAHALLPIASIARNGSLIVAGDPRQLPPIQQAKPPLGLEDMTGSVYSYFTGIRNIGQAILQKNYRSNDTIVKFAHEAGYDRSLTSYSPDLRLNLLNEELFRNKPLNWPAKLFWTSSWSLLLDPVYSATCFVYPEGRCGQWNEFEADAISALTFILFHRLGNQLLNERNPGTGEIDEVYEDLYSDELFWKQGLGIVTPHRAQEALIVSRLQQLFTPLGVESSLIRDAVDTVERYQGQQRDVILASYALGDPDAIRDEDEFLMNANRFNVMVSRARAKIIVFTSQEVVSHLSGDLDILRQSVLLKNYTESFCENRIETQLGHILPGTAAPRLVNGMVRSR